jgi:hypothetical protein
MEVLKYILIYDFAFDLRFRVTSEQKPSRTINDELPPFRDEKKTEATNLVSLSL